MRYTYTVIISTPNYTKMPYPDIEVNLDNMMLYILRLLCNIRSFNALIVKLEYTNWHYQILILYCINYHKYFQIYN